MDTTLAVISFEGVACREWSGKTLSNGIRAAERCTRGRRGDARLWCRSNRFPCLGVIVAASRSSMAARKKVTAKKKPRRKAAKRELIDTGTNKLFVRRNKRGTSFKEVEDWPVSDSGPTPQGQERSEARPREPGRSAPVTPKVRREPTVKAPWGDLLTRVPEPHVVVAVLPGLSETEGIVNAHSAQRLMVRLIRKLRIRGEFVTVSRHLECRALKLTPHALASLRKERHGTDSKTTQ
jgi:hypothetical protein